MECYLHPGKEAVAFCSYCGRPVCNDCRIFDGAAVHCARCALGFSAEIGMPKTARRPNWFERHLNWTAVLSWIAFYTLCFMVGLLVGSLWSSLGVLGEDTRFNILLYTALIGFGAAWLIPSNAWILRQKGRSLWWLLLPIAPFGWIVFLSLENRNERETKGVLTSNKLGWQLWTLTGTVFVVAIMVCVVVLAGAWRPDGRTKIAQTGGITLLDAPAILNISSVLPSTFDRAIAADKGLSKTALKLGENCSEVQVFLSNEPFQILYLFMYIAESEQLSIGMFKSMSNDEALIAELKAAFISVSAELEAQLLEIHE